MSRVTSFFAQSTIVRNVRDVLQNARRRWKAVAATISVIILALLLYIGPLLIWGQSPASILVSGSALVLYLVGLLHLVTLIA